MLALIAVSFLLDLQATAQRAFSADSLKAAMIQKIIAFIRWPKRAGLEGLSAPFVMRVLGHPDLAARLRFLYATQTLAGHRVEIVETQGLEQLNQGHALLIGSSFQGQLDQILERVEGAPVLTLGDTPGFAARGVAVNLFVDAQRRVGFEVNRASLTRAELSPSYQLLQFARLIPRTGGEP
jgi:hypothetical protein